MRTLNQHFRLVLSVWHHEELVQVAGTCDMCAWFQHQSQDPAWFFCFPGEHRAGRGWGRLRRDGL